MTRNRKRAKGTPKTSTIAIYASIFALIAAVVAVGYHAPQQLDGIANATTIASDARTQKTSVNELVATNLAAGLAETINLSVATNIANLSVSLTAKSELTQTNDTVIAKPQILQPTAESRVIIAYTVKVGDTVDSLATQYGISKDTIKWANNLTSDALIPGTVLQILPTDGVQYAVKAGDTVAGLADRYKADATRIVAFNDLEIDGLTGNKKIIIPGGTLPATERPGYIAPPRTNYQTGGGMTGSTAATAQLALRSAGNKYARGYCTDWAYERRVQLGRPVGSYWGNATTWDIYARAAGLRVDHIPEAGAVYQMKANIDSSTGAAGHVGIVESINPDGSIYVSDMNYGPNFNRVTNRTISAGQAALYNYIH